MQKHHRFRFLSLQNDVQYLLLHKGPAAAVFCHRKPTCSACSCESTAISVYCHCHPMCSACLVPASAKAPPFVFSVTILKLAVPALAKTTIISVFCS
jgi:hypothetical protein